MKRSLPTIITPIRRFSQSRGFCETIKKRQIFTPLSREEILAKYRFRTTEWIATRVGRLLPGWYKRNDMGVISLGAGNALRDVFQTNALKDEGCSVGWYILVDKDPSPLLPNDHNLVLPDEVKAKRVVASMENIKLRLPNRVSVFFNSLHGDDTGCGALNEVTFGPLKSPLTFLVGNAFYPFYTAEGEFIDNLFKKIRSMNMEIEIETAVLEDSIHFDLISREEDIDLCFPANELMKTKAAKTHWRALKKRQQNGDIIKDEEAFVHFGDQWCCMINFMSKDPLYDPILTWQRSGHGPGYE